MKMDAETRALQPPAKECLKCPEVRRGKEGWPPRALGWSADRAWPC